MKSGMLLFIVIAWMATTVVSQGFQQSTVPCAQSPGNTGYDSIEAMNVDIDNEIQAIIGGKQAEQSYQFVLCPNTEFDASNATLRPLLDGSTFLCGNQGRLQDQCVIRGGTTQVEIGESLGNTPPINTIDFSGITFAGFTERAFGGDTSSSNTTVTILRSSFSVSSFT